MCQKVGYVTRQQALDVMKQVVWRNAVEDREERSRGLNIYRCGICQRYHIGHAKEEGQGQEGDRMRVRERRRRSWSRAK